MDVQHKNLFSWNKSWSHSEGGDVLEQVAQGRDEYPIPGDIQGQAGCGFGKPGLVAGDPV